MTEREKQVIRLIDQVKASPAKITAVKVECEGRLSREDRCGENCTARVYMGTSHLTCKRFNDVKVANDFLLKYLAKWGLAERGSTAYSHMYKPKYPVAFSKVYTDSETEWTITIDLKESKNILHLPRLIDAFNALAIENGRGIDVNGSGMHMAFLQGKDGIYPSTSPSGQIAYFNNFKKSMTPLLPALYLLGANRIEGGVCVTRSTGPRQPTISNTEKYSAIAYRQGALEFRVFDTCYENRDQILDNVAVMARSVSKYWRKKYRSPGMYKLLEKPVYFGNSNDNDMINNLESLYKLKEQVLLLNEGLKRIKPPYMSISEVKKVRNFTLTAKKCKALNMVVYEREYIRYSDRAKVQAELEVARAYYQEVDAYLTPNHDISKFRRNGMRKVRRMIEKQLPLKPIQMVAYELEFGRAYPLGDI